MAGFDANEHLTPFRDARGYGAILFDRAQLRQPDPAWFDPGHWGAAAQAIAGGGRGGAWQIAMEGGGQAFLRQYLRGGLAARVSRDAHLWRGIGQVRSFVEYRLLRELRVRGLPVPRPYAACYRREGLAYRAAILMQWLPGVRSLAARMDEDAPPWAEAGELVARFHRQGLDHADLNAHNLLFDAEDRGWLVDLDRSRLRIPATAWREANLARLQRSLRKLAGARAPARVEAGFRALRAAYDAAWQRGY
jgi:3-deoxy-D-manno-octulosonic acid kinase